MRLRTWSENSTLLLIERILKMAVIIITPIGIFWAAFWPPEGPSHVAYFAPLAGAWLLWIVGTRLRQRGGFGRTHVIIRNIAAAFAVLLTLAAVLTGSWLYVAVAVPFALLAVLTPKIALRVAQTRRARVERALREPGAVAPAQATEETR